MMRGMSYNPIISSSILQGPSFGTMVSSQSLTSLPEIKSREMIKPSSPTPSHKKIHKLSFLDQIFPPIYLPFIFFYQTELNKSEFAEKSMLLKRTLSETLTDFYPLAGKLENYSSINCNDQGVEYCEARVDHSLSEAIHNPNLDELLKLLPFRPTTNNKSILAGFQLNHFCCGSVAISVCISHRFADGETLFAFIKAWADKACGSVQNIHQKFTFNSSSLFPPRYLGWIIANAKDTYSKEKIVTRRFIFDKERIDLLRKQCLDATSIDKAPSRVEVVSACIWKELIEVARAKPNPPKVYNAAQAINLRTIESSPVPGNCYGNLVWVAIASAQVQQGVNQLTELIRELRTAVKQIDVSSWEKIKSWKCLLHLVKMLETKTQAFCCFSSCTRFPLYEMNFGWGNPIWVSMTPLPFKNYVVLLNTKCGQGIEAWVNMIEQDVEFPLHSRI